MATSPHETKVALLEGVVARVRATVEDDEAGQRRAVRPRLLRQRRSRGSDRPERARPRRGRARALEPRARSAARRAQGARLHAEPGGARLGVAAHGRRDRERRHAVPRRLDLDGGEPARAVDPPRRCARSCGCAATTAAGCSRSERTRGSNESRDPPRARPADRRGGDPGAPRRPAPRPRRRARGGRGLAADAAAHQGHPHRARREPAARRRRRSWPKRARSSSGWRTTTSRSSATASTTC